MGAIADAPLQQWATFYDIRRYGGLQIFLRALSGQGSLSLGGDGESVGSLLARFGAAGITHISGTPSHWRKVLMSGEGRRIDPDYVRLSGEIADDAILGALRALYPRARIEHAYASTEAGVVFAVDDGRAGFPASWLDSDGAVQMKVVDGSLRVRSDRCALRFLGADAPPLADEDGFVDTGDMVERRGDRLYFVGRRGGVINVGGAKVHPEEVEAALNAHAAVRASRVFARKSPITGALVFAEVVLRDERLADAAAEREILAACRARLAAAHGSGGTAVRRRPADDRRRKARAAWIMSSSRAPAEALASRSPIGLRATASESSPSRAATAKRSATTAKLAERGPGALVFRPLDLSDVAAIPTFVRELRRQFGPIYGLVNNAGLGTAGLLATMPDAEIERSDSASTRFRRSC